MTYKPVLPSSLLTEQTKEQVDFGKKIFGNNTLKMGVVVTVIEPESDDNISKMGTEYHVMAIEQDGRQGINSSIYKNCLPMDSFGGIADFFQFKRRTPKDSKKVQDKASTKDQEGSIVLLLCLDGNAEKAVIIGQMQNPSRKVNLNEEAGHSGEGEFNGIRYAVDKDGAFTMTFKGATDDDGKPNDASVAGSQFKIEKDGSVEINDASLDAELAKGNRKPKDEEEETAEEEAAEGIANEKIRIDRAAMTVLLEARKDILVTTDAGLNLTAKAGATITCMDLIAKAEGTAMLETAGTFDLKAGGAFSLKAPDVNIESDNGVMIKTSQVIIDAPLIQVGSGGSPALILSTQFQGVGNLGAPIISLAIGPFSSSVFIAS